MLMNGIMVVPEIDIPGHALLSVYPEIGKQR
jgi:N-acetyl-beta-hexosaminidase